MALLSVDPWPFTRRNIERTIISAIFKMCNAQSGLLGVCGDLRLIRRIRCGCVIVVVLVLEIETPSTCRSRLKRRKLPWELPPLPINDTCD